jgi:hypothetical protein
MIVPAVNPDSTDSCASRWILTCWRVWCESRPIRIVLAKRTAWLLAQRWNDVLAWPLLALLFALILVFLALWFGGWFWGVAGFVIAVPSLVAVKVAATHSSGGRALVELAGSISSVPVGDRQGSG